MFLCVCVCVQFVLINVCWFHCARQRLQSRVAAVVAVVRCCLQHFYVVVLLLLRLLFIYRELCNCFLWSNLLLELRVVFA